MLSFSTSMSYHKSLNKVKDESSISNQTAIDPCFLGNRILSLLIWQGPSVDNLVITVDGLSAFAFFIRQGPGINNLIITINGFSTFGLLVRE